MADSTPIGTVVGSVSVSESDVRKDIVYGLEHAIGENIVQSEPTPLPFRVDNKTGEVFTNQSLAKSVHTYFPTTNHIFRILFLMSRISNFIAFVFH